MLNISLIILSIAILGQAPIFYFLADRLIDHKLGRIILQCLGVIFTIIAVILFIEIVKINLVN